MWFLGGNDRYRIPVSDYTIKLTGKDLSKATDIYNIMELGKTNKQKSLIEH